MIDKNTKEVKEVKISFSQKIKNKWEKEAKEVNPLVRFLIIIFVIIISTIISVVLKEAFNISITSFVILYLVFYNGFIWFWNNMCKSKK